MINEVKKVVARERDALNILENNLDGLEKVLQVLFTCKGRIVFMGGGKSGHIGKKMAATFASLGLSSFFVHATEAMHGDLGMIQPKDVAVLISNSGTTQEVVQCVKPLKNNGVTTIAYTSRINSTLATECDYLILYPKLNEADDNNLAPTVSSTLTLVLGDAIACALSKAKDFTREDFHKYHPNGALGEMLKKEQKDG